MLMNIRTISCSITYFFLVLGFIGCKSDEEKAIQDFGLADRTITRISITDRNHRVLDIEDSVDVHYFLSQLRSLSAREEGNVYQEYFLTFYEEYDENQNKIHVTSLRMGKDCIGPMVSESAVATRWYFEDDLLYNFINDKFRRVNSKGIK
jgi:hypothetical protein